MTRFPLMFQHDVKQKLMFLSVPDEYNLWVPAQGAWYDLEGNVEGDVHGFEWEDLEFMKSLGRYSEVGVYGYFRITPTRSHFKKLESLQQFERRYLRYYGEDFSTATLDTFSTRSYLGYRENVYEADRVVASHLEAVVGYPNSKLEFEEIITPKEHDLAKSRKIKPPTHNDLFVIFSSFDYYIMAPVI